MILSLILVLPMISAGMYEVLQSFESRTCSYQDPDGISSSPSFTALQSKFGLVYDPSADCVFILDVTPLSDATDFALYAPWYAYTAYKIDNSIDYLIITGKDNTAINEMMDFIVGYDTTYQYYVKEYDPNYLLSFSMGNYIYLPEGFFTGGYNADYTGPDDENCVMDGVESIYSGDGGSSDEGSFAPSCVDANTLEYPFCFAEDKWTSYFNCDCQNNKCIADRDFLFGYLSNMGNYMGPDGRMIDDEFINSVIISWLNN